MPKDAKKTFFCSTFINCWLLFFGWGGGNLPRKHPLPLLHTERIDRSGWRFVKFQFQNMERRSVKVPKFGTSIRNGVKKTAFHHALPFYLWQSRQVIEWWELLLLGLLWGNDLRGQGQLFFSSRPSWLLPIPSSSPTHIFGGIHQDWSGLVSHRPYFSPGWDSWFPDHITLLGVGSLTY